MRKKAEQKIRNAVAELGNPDFPRIDAVRQKAGLLRKVFDKTVLDMQGWEQSSFSLLAAQI